MNRHLFYAPFSPLTFYFLLLLELDLLLDFFVVVFLALDFVLEDLEAVDLVLVLFAADSVFDFDLVDLSFAVEADLEVVFLAAGFAVVFFAVDLVVVFFAAVLVVVFLAAVFGFSAVFLTVGLVFAAVFFGAALVSFFGSSASAFFVVERTPIESINTRV